MNRKATREGFGPRALGIFVLIAVSACPSVHLSAQISKASTRILDSLLDTPPFNRQLWGVALVDQSGRLLYGRNADRLFIPASNTKLVVSAVASALLPPDWTVKTSVYSNGPVRNGAVQGDLVLYGRGDPTESKRCYSTDTAATGVCDSDPFGRLRVLAGALRSQGITSVVGDLVGDGSYFDAELVHPNWENYDLNWWYAAPVSGLGFNDNSVDIAWGPGPSDGAPASLSLTPNLGDLALENRSHTLPAGSDDSIDFFRIPGTLSIWATGGVAHDSKGGTEYLALPDPDLYAARAFRLVLADSGISVQGTTRSTLDSLAYAPARAGGALAETPSRPLSDWVFPILNESQNWFADMLVKQLGRQFGTGGSWHAGLEVERRFLIDSMAIDSTLFSLSDGSGLSSTNLIAPMAFTRLLQFIRRHPHYQTFKAGLPQSGHKGSLRTRFVNTPLEGRVWAKTGSISGVNSLSGYVDLPSGRSLAFSIQANHHVLGGRLMLARIDSLVVAMARVAGKGK